MNEASSRYVDQIATQKLLTEKLGRVHHAPTIEDAGHMADIGDLASLPLDVGRIATHQEAGTTIYTFPSAIATPYAENNTVRCRYHPAKDPVGEIVLVHGLYEDNLQIYAFLISLLQERGLRVHLLILPYHYERRPAGSAFSGEYFWSADMGRSALAYRQAMGDLFQWYGHLRRQGKRPVWIVGFSMGGGVALTLSSLALLDGVVAVNPVCNLPDLMWHRPLFGPIKADLEAGGVALSDIEARYGALDPLACGPGATPVSRIVLARGLYDEINAPANYDLLAARWGLEQVIDYKAGHLNILRVPKLAADVAGLYERYRQADMVGQGVFRGGVR